MSGEHVEMGVGVGVLHWEPILTNAMDAEVGEFLASGVQRKAEDVLDVPEPSKVCFLSKNISYWLGFDFLCYKWDQGQFCIGK